MLVEWIFQIDIFTLCNTYVLFLTYEDTAFFSFFLAIVAHDGELLSISGIKKGWTFEYFSLFRNAQPQHMVDCL